MDENEHPFSLFNREDTAGQASAGGPPHEMGAPDVPPPPPGDGTLGPTSLSRPPMDEAWSFGARGGGKGLQLGLPRGKRSVALALVVVLVAAAGSYVFLNRRSSSGGTAFALALSRDKSYSYSIHMGMQGKMSLQGQQVPFNMEVDQAVTWRVESVDGDGTATVAVNMQNVSGQVNGQAIPAIPAETSRIRVAKDGRMLSVGNLSLTSGTDFGSVLPGSDQFMPLLPNHPVKIGDEWTKKFDQDLPFGMGRLRYRVESTLLRYQTVNGNKMALIFSTLSVPLDMTIDLKKVMSASGGSADQIIPGDPKMKFGGTMKMEQTSWFDQAHGELYRTSGNASFNMTIEFKDFPQSQNPPGGQMGFTGTMNVNVQQLESTPKPTKEAARALKAAQDKKVQANLRNALVAAKVYFTDHNSYAGFNPAAAEKLEPSLAYNTSGTAKKGQVSIRAATKNAVLLVDKSASGTVFCIAEQVDGKVTYGKRDVKSVSGCTGGW